MQAIKSNCIEHNNLNRMVQMKFKTGYMLKHLLLAVLTCCSLIVCAQVKKPSLSKPSVSVSGVIGFSYEAIR